MLRKLVLPLLSLLTISCSKNAAPIPGPKPTVTKIVTAGYSIARLNANTSETILTQASIQSGFGRVGQYAVDGFVYAQPLIVPTTSKNLLIVATMHDSLFAFDADAPGSAPVWHVNFGPSLPVTPIDTDFISNEAGCLSTPVVDATAQIVYAACVTSAGVWKLYSVHLADGSTYLPPTTFGGTFGGISFNNSVQNQRPALLLSKGLIYVAFGSYSDTGSYHGWIMAVDTISMTQVAAWCDTCGTSTGQGGIWMAGAGLAADTAGNVYVETGNGYWDGILNFGDSFVKLSPTLQVLSYMTPANQGALDAEDMDLGSSGPMLVNGQVMGTGKDGRWWFLNQANLGGIQTAATPMMQTCPNGVYAGQAFANNNLFLGCGDGPIQRYQLNGSTFNFGAQTAESFFFPGGSLTYSSNAQLSGSDILWAMTYGPSGSTAPQGVLYAYVPQTLAQIYSSNTNPTDIIGSYVKFVAPMVMNGKVYVAAANTVTVFAKQ